MPEVETRVPPQTFVVAAPQAGTPPVLASVAKQLVDQYVESRPGVVAARERHKMLYDAAERVAAIAIPSALFGAVVAGLSAFVGLGALDGQVPAVDPSSAFTVSAVATGISCIGVFLNRAYERIWKHAVEPAKAQLEAARAEARGAVQSPDDLAAVAKQLAAKAAA